MPTLTNLFQSLKGTVHRTKFIFNESEAQGIEPNLQTLEPNFASFKSRPQVVELKALLQLTKIEGLVIWDGLTSEVQIETPNAFSPGLRGHTE
jgi:hypothetical protein